MIWVLLIACGVVLWMTVAKSVTGKQEQTLALSLFREQVLADKVKKANISGSEIHGEMRDGSLYRVSIPVSQPGASGGYPEMYNELQQHHVEVTAENANN